MSIDVNRAIDQAARIGELSHEVHLLRAMSVFERDSFKRMYMYDLMDKLTVEIEALRADPCGVLGRARTG